VSKKRVSKTLMIMLSFIGGLALLVVLNMR